MRWKQLVCAAFGCLVSLTAWPEAEGEGAGAGSENSVLKRIPCQVSQGVAVDAEYFYAISNIRIVKYGKGVGDLIAEWHAEKQSDAYKHFRHLNSGSVVDGKLYCAHSRYGVDPNDNSIEIWNVAERKLEHEKTIHLPRKYGSLTWIDRDRDGCWWMCYAVYGAAENKDTKIVKYQYEDGTFVEIKSWSFPEEVIVKWGKMSCSGGSWGADGYLYTTGHDGAAAYVLEVGSSEVLKLVRTENGMGFWGQAVAWDRSSAQPVLWGITKNKYVSLTLIPWAARALAPQGLEKDTRVF